MNDFETLVDTLRNTLGPSSGINDDDVDPTQLQSLMADYVSSETEWKRYAFELPTVPYTRNLVDKGNGKCNLVSIANIAVSSTSLIIEACPRLVPREE